MHGRTDGIVRDALEIYGFLASLLDQATLERAAIAAARTGVEPHEVLFAENVISPQAYTVALARSLGAPVIHWNWAFHETHGLAGDCLIAHDQGYAYHVLSATNASPRQLWLDVAARRRAGESVALASGAMLDAILATRRRRRHTDLAINALRRQQPEGSAGVKGPLWQRLVGACAAASLAAGVVLYLEATIALATAVIALPFLFVTLLRVMALLQMLAKPSSTAAKARRSGQDIPDEQLPVYTVMVPLLRETRVLPDLIASLSALDYPAAKLEIFLVLEASDPETQAALLDVALPGNFRVVVVPASHPQTKPKALNYTMQLARGDYVVVYDAEDAPDPSLLRQALRAFRDAPPNLGCLQAQLNIHNVRQGWLTRGLMAQTPQEVNPS